MIVQALETLFGSLDNVELQIIAKSLGRLLIERKIRKHELNKVITQIVCRLHPKNLSRDELFNVLWDKVEAEEQRLNHKLLDIYEQKELMKQPGYNYWGHKIFTPDGGCLYAEDAERIVGIIEERERKIRELTETA